ncbi:hypothetical protein FBUS_11641 [Fasciolopsis buskii]|uniref:G-protein coupled receptors family 1 profile domain-containing protein n=1 Tax=Fasciolopsis buskii TaxID=27845 RepID=A0A8E0S9Y9_9TREM|nr:hypothetical protein FBUS_11641 [Fasciolopsis buski]
MLVVCNFIALSLDRFWAVVRAKSYKSNMKRYQIFCALFPFFYSLLAILPEYFSDRFANAQNTDTQKKCYYYLTEVVEIVSRFVIPLGTIIILNSLIIRKLQTSTSRRPASQVLESSLSQVTNGRNSTMTIQTTGTITTSTPATATTATTATTTTTTTTTTSTTTTNTNTAVKKIDTSPAPNKLTKYCVMSADKALLICMFGFTAELTITEVISFVVSILNFTSNSNLAYGALLGMIYGFVIVCCSSLNPLLQILTMKKMHDAVVQMGFRLWIACGNFVRRCQKFKQAIGSRVQLNWSVKSSEATGIQATSF